MKDIKRLRDEVDRIDLKTLRLLERRVAIAGEIGRAKRKMKISYHDPKREGRVLENVARDTVLKKTFVKRIFKDIMEYCRNGEHE